MIGGKEGDKAERKWRIEENRGGEMMMRGKRHRIEKKEMGRRG